MMMWWTTVIGFDTDQSVLGQPRYVTLVRYRQCGISDTWHHSILNYEKLCFPILYLKLGILAGFLLKSQISPKLGLRWANPVV